MDLILKFIPIVTVCFMMINAIIMAPKTLYDSKVALKKFRKKGKAVMKTNMETSPSSETTAIVPIRRSRVRLVVGAATILVPSITLAILSFGPEKSTALTTNGNAASIAGALILALFASIVIRE